MMPMLPWDGSSSVIPVARAESFNPEWCLSSATLTWDGPDGALRLRNLNAVPAAFTDQLEAGKLKAADSPEAARIAKVAPTTLGSPGPPTVGATRPGAFAEKAARCALEAEVRRTSERPGSS